MKVITKTVIDMNSLETLEEESFEYEGEVALCGGSGGGGGNSGKVDFPDYMKSFHKAMLNDSDNNPYTGKPVSQVLEDTLDATPLATAMAYNPETETSDMVGAAETQLTKVDNMTDSDEIFDFDTTILPRFEGGMRDIGAVQSSAFAQGRANLMADYAAKVASTKLKLRDAAVGKVIEANRMVIEAFNTQTDRDIELEMQEATWELQMYKYAGNILGSIQGTQIPQNEGGGGKMSAAGAALSGAGTGAMIGAEVGGGYGAVAGAVIGAAVGYGSTLL